ncbi:LLM class F420-dependent oxidoreductase [Mycolicibacterium aichiense]|uniref:LLM class F420-dependent oxidoreductase n=1 Tax=Mycolicibacterium aichiense TaxID=1799 RepID=A0AAD1MB71_9MYCO|nr:LLM class F420-dependent oxidoreductase [Mycolicibacterium aichiense]MCV7021422.1 LLM class F420-dependent oxidoreductase [Mycolicibacterium aichiense]BBX06004.1 LLM class F420-dependent oxidoreductase [Mycolicibacterium aichiense]STZ24657.1 monooxygenase [Mycolicibacterium aichiense]
MTTGVVLLPNPAAPNAVDDVIAAARAASAVVVRQVWFAQRFDLDAITLAAVVGAAVPGLGVGTSVVPLNPRHPLIVASLAQTAQAASHGNFSLGLGLGAHEPERVAFGQAWPDTITRLREHLTVLRSVFDTGAVHFHGRTLSADPAWDVRVPGGAPVPVYVAAMGPRALAVTGELADGTLPYLAGPRTIGDFIVPTIGKAATDAGRPAPRVIAAVPVLVTDDVSAGRAIAAEELDFYTTIPSYQNVIAREGVDSVAELAAVGPARSVLRQLRAYLDAGATDLVLSPLRSQDAPPQPLWEVAAAL